MARIRIDSLGNNFRLRQLRQKDLFHAAHALEDLPDNVREEGSEILQTPTGISFARRDFDVLENAVLDAYGHLELVRVLRFLSRYPVTAYTYTVSPLVSRGDRPDSAKIRSLHDEGFGATIDLCAETPQGDLPAIEKAHLKGSMATYHYGIVDMTPPSTGQMVEILEKLRDLHDHGIKAYIHCEAGKSRTGVVIACYRMAVLGWSVTDALQEAINFGDSVPMQQEFIESFGAALTEQFDARERNEPLPHPELKGYPFLRPGSVEPTARELSITLKEVAATEERGLD